MWTLIPNHIQADQLGYLRSNDGLCIIVIGNLINNALAGGIYGVDQLRSSIAISNGFEGGNFLRVVIVKKLKTRRVGKEIRLVFVQLNIWNETWVAYVLGEILLQHFNPLLGNMIQLLSLIQSRKPGSYLIQINHGGEEHICIFLLL